MDKMENNTKILLGVVLGVLVLVLIVQTLQISSLSNVAAVTSNAVSQAPAPSGGAMVGGC